MKGLHKKMKHDTYFGNKKKIKYVVTKDGRLYKWTKTGEKLVGRKIKARLSVGETTIEI
jgi:hypothetical protein